MAKIGVARIGALADGIGYYWMDLRILVDTVGGDAAQNGLVS